MNSLRKNLDSKFAVTEFVLNHLVDKENQIKYTGIRRLVLLDISK
jgi:hypothetical protein